MRRRGLLGACVGVATLLVAVLLATPARGEYVFVKKWGSQGEAVGQFDIPLGIEQGPNGDLFVADADNERVQAFDPAGGLRFAWSTDPVDPFAMYGSFPRELAIDPFGFVYVLDAISVSASDYMWTVNKYTTSGNFIQNLAPPADGDITDITTDGAGNLYMAISEDAGGASVMKLSPTGVLLARWSVPVSGDHPTASGIAVDTNGFVYVGIDAMDLANFRAPISVVHRLTGTGNLVASWGGKPTSATSPGGLDGVGDIEVAPNGSVYVLEDTGDSQIQEFNATGGFLGQFEPRTARAIALGSDGLIYVTGFSEVNVFRSQPSPPRVKKGRGTTRKRKMSIKFSGTGAVGFECRLTGKGVQKKLKRWRRCRSPKRYTGLRVGRKVFQVRGVDAAGTRGKPAAKKWVIIP